MKPGDYFLKEDVALLTEDEYSSIRSYLQLLGFKCSSEFGSYFDIINTNYKCVELYKNGDLYWSPIRPYGNRIPLNEMKRMAHLGMMV